MSIKNHRKRRRSHFRRQAPPGAPPGVLIGDPQACPTSIRMLAYGANGCEELEVTDMRQIGEALVKWPIVWVNVDGLADVSKIAALGKIFDLHQLALEDVIHPHQRAKVDSYGNHLYIVMRVINAGGIFEDEQISVFMGSNFVLTFQEIPGDTFDTIRKRIHELPARLHHKGPDYLVYALLDNVLDSYFPILEDYGEKLERLEQEIILCPTTNTISKVHQIKRELFTIRRAVWPMREAVSELVRDSTPFITDSTRVYLRDCYDHTIQIIDLLETYRELGSDLVDSYLSSISNRMNEIMKVLTIISTIFIPLTFIAGVYGMNFDPNTSPWNMPELKWYLGYPFALMLMGIVTICMIIFFRRRGWLGGARADRAINEENQGWNTPPTEKSESRRE